MPCQENTYNFDQTYDNNTFCKKCDDSVGFNCNFQGNLLAP